MKLKTKLIMLAVCILLFVIVVPLIILYSLGYRIDLINLRVIATGGIYVREVPTGAYITIDSKIKNTTGIFSNSIFVQNLLPTQHNVLIQKDGYYDYQKNLPVKENTVTKLENVVLFKKNINFTPLAENVDYFSTAPNNTSLLTAEFNAKNINFQIIDLNTNQAQPFLLVFKNGAIVNTQWSDNSNKAILAINNTYYLLDLSSGKPVISAIPSLVGAKELRFNPQDLNEIFYIKNKNLYSTLQTSAIIKNIISYQIQNQNIIYFAQDGFLYNFSNSDNSTAKITELAFSVNKNDIYQLKIIGGKTFLEEGGSLFILNEATGKFEPFYQPIIDIKGSPDGQKFIYYNDSGIMLYYPTSVDQKNGILASNMNQIGNCLWLNSDYIVFTSGDSIIISELDTRGAINKITLPSTISLSGKSFSIEKPNIFFNQQDKKLYMLTQNNLLVSEPIIP